MCVYIDTYVCLMLYVPVINFHSRRVVSLSLLVDPVLSRGQSVLFKDIAQSVTCLTTDPGATSSIPAQSHTFMEIGHEIISTAILLHFVDLRRVVVSYKRKYVHIVLVKG